MSGSCCCVPACKSSWGNAKKTGETLRFFTFPKDPKVKLQWTKLCKKHEGFKGRVCGKHFGPEQFEDGIQAQIFNCAPRRLKRTAVPTLFMTATHEVKSESERQKRKKVKERKELVKQILQEQEIEEVKQPTPLELLQAKYDCLDTEHRKAVAELLKKTDECSQLNHKLRLTEFSLQIAENNRERYTKERLKGFLSGHQLDVVLKKISRAKWTEDELSKAYDLWCINEEAYFYVKQILRYPLPGLSTVQKYAFNLNKQSTTQTLPEQQEGVVVIDQSDFSVQIVSENVLYNEHDYHKSQEMDQTNKVTIPKTSNSNKHVMQEKECLPYLAGFLAYEHKTDHPELSQHDCTVPTILSCNIPSWVQKLDFDTLTEPSQSWLSACQQMEYWFVKLHKDKFRFKKFLDKMTANFISHKLPQIPKALVMSFVKHRLVVRIKYNKIRNGTLKKKGGKRGRKKGAVMKCRTKKPKQTTHIEKCVKQTEP